jgi:pyridinium-3,5-biscarboxylic acid mononucleotide sulfurtransferase
VISGPRPPAVTEADPKENLGRLVEWFRAFNSCIVAFSAGVDSSLLALAAKSALGTRAYAVTSLSPAFAVAEREEARRISSEIGIELVEVSQDDLNDSNYVKNEVSRCYFCRTNLAIAILPIAEKLLINLCVDGTHVDDLEKPRPGVKALRENGFRAPLVELGFGKNQIREMARHAGLSNWNRPSEACLSSRVAYGQSISLNTLQLIEKAEEIVKSLTGAEIVRVRTIGSTAVIEVDKPHVFAAENRLNKVREKLNEFGYESVSIDPEGYASGNMLELFVKSTER